MLFGVAHLRVDKEIDSKFVGVRDIEVPIKENGTVKIEKEPILIYKVIIKDKELFVTIAVGRGVPMLYIASDLNLLLRQINQLERDLRGEIEE